MDAQSNHSFKIQPLTLRFPGPLEEDFQIDYFQKSLNHLRFAVALAILLYALFGILDALMIPAVSAQAWFIRYAIVCPYLILFLLFTWTRYFRKVAQPAIALSVLVVGFGIIAFTVIAYPPGSYYYYAGLILVLMWAYTVTTARFIYATFAAWTIVIVYEIVAFGGASTPLPVLISNNFFFLSANILGMLACYLIEYYKRRDFWQRRLLEEERAKSEGLLYKLHSELVLASDIQKSLMPLPYFDRPDVEIICYYKPTIEIGGDFYSYHELEDGGLALAVGDVSGNGIPAALLMAATQSLFSATFAQPLEPCERMSHLDRALVPYTEPRCQNCAFCYLELEHGLLHIVNAGGIPPYLRTADGRVERLRVEGFPLGHGFGAELGYAGVQVRLSPGDLVVLVSDGIVEAKDPRGEMFDFKRLEQAIASGPHGSAQAMLDHLVKETLAFVGSSELNDDLTALVLRVKA